MKFKVGDKVKIPTTKSTSVLGGTEDIRCSGAVSAAKKSGQDYMFVVRVYEQENYYSVASELGDGGDFFLEQDLQPYEDIPEQAMRFNSGKPKVSLIHNESMLPMVKVLEFGAKKYAAHNWKKPMDKVALLESLKRHVDELIDKVNAGEEEIDGESGEHIMGHIQCNAMFYNYHFVIDAK